MMKISLILALMFYSSGLSVIGELLIHHRTPDTKLSMGRGCIISGICSLFLAAAGLSGGTDILTLLRFATLAGLLPVASRIDRRMKIIPNSLILFLLGMWVFHFGLLGLAYPGSVLSFLSDSLAGGLIGLSLILVRLLTKRSLGMGDIKLLTVTGLYLGRQYILPALLLSLILAAAVAGSKLLRKQQGMKDCISFGPYIAAGTLVVAGGMVV